MKAVNLCVLFGDIRTDVKSCYDRTALDISINHSYP